MLEYAHPEFVGLRLDFGEIRYEVGAFDDRTGERLWSFGYTEIRPFDFLNTKLQRYDQLQLQRLVRVEGNMGDVLRFAWPAPSPAARASNETADSNMEVDEDTSRSRSTLFPMKSRIMAVYTMVPSLEELVSSLYDQKNLMEPIGSSGGLA